MDFVIFLQGFIVFLNSCKLYFKLGVLFLKDKKRSRISNLLFLLN